MGVHRRVGAPLIRSRPNATKSRGLRLLVGARDGWVCCYCTAPLRPEGLGAVAAPNARRATLEHRLALCNGGTNDLVNLALACGPCNQGKSSTDRPEHRGPIPMKGRDPIRDACVVCGRVSVDALYCPHCVRAASANVRACSAPEGAL